MTITLKARVRTVTGNTMHAVGAIFHGEPTAISPIPAPHSVAIAATEKGVFLLYLDEFGAYFTDTWHESLDMAKAQAAFEFDISESDWKATYEEARLSEVGWGQGAGNRPKNERSPLAEPGEERGEERGEEKPNY